MQKDGEQKNEDGQIGHQEPVIQDDLEQKVDQGEFHDADDNNEENKDGVLLSQQTLKKRDAKFASKPKQSKSGMDMTTFTRLTDRLDLVEDNYEKLQKQNQKMEEQNQKMGLDFEKLLEHCKSQAEQINYMKSLLDKVFTLQPQLEAKYQVNSTQEQIGQQQQVSDAKKEQKDWRTFLNVKAIERPARISGNT